MSQQELQALLRQLEEAQRPRAEEQRRREQAEERLRIQPRETTLPEFLDACHVHLFLGLSVQEDPHASNHGQSGERRP
ncbi:uncharacterized protein BO66DRAFT_390609 [Aspergillus aculeatinus CBS 121060]|uniref:Uncharacterized protein n=1 Tax=Aspergillus aculeatinus CBS 121060 TaxID=1448322 RepID=A0ACD1HDU6_9EURO|nr:hypothetical protein BO66DRAFT_390609 [Aspergillus aculeatinus CBS 121060]RAH71763.1 hypothetical protein BO66DRAFT_390609 [Aspergillus aculeatinus CBS 121060]